MKSLSQEEALKSILTKVKPLLREYIPIENCVGRTLAADMVSKIFSPPANSAAMDGYGVNNLNFSNENIFTLVGEVAAGKNYKKDILPGQAIRIFTGASVPNGINKIFPQEKLEKKEGDKLKFLQSRESFIRPKGSNFKLGFKLKKDTLLNPTNISLLASMNFNKIPVRKKPKVAIISIGNELLYPGSKLTKAKIISSNAYGIKAFCERKMADVHLQPIVPDKLDKIVKIITKCLQYDIIITIGGASVGKFDLVEDAAEKAGIKFLFTRINMKPGKPFKAGTKDKTLLLSMPGNPVSSLICSQIFLGPVLDKFQAINKNRAIIKASLVQGLSKNGPRKHYMRAVATLKNNKWFVKPYSDQNSHNLAVMNKANSLIIRREFDDAVKTGELVKIIKLEI